ncbi:hypothetical protein AGMMS49940_10570 [Spirochaetia bacterium]|nr:hypothetical protein AGMMS49940_10570 [Spirochaetia bacterium]
MAKSSNDEQKRYQERTSGFREAIDDILKREKETLSLLQQNSEDASGKLVGLAEDMLNLSSNYIILSDVSQAILGTRDEDPLNDARKSLVRAVTYMEKVVSNYIDVPFSDYEDKLAGIADMGTAERYRLVRKIGLTIRLLEDAFGENSKWKWAFVELRGRFSTVAKNILDLKKAMANTDPRSPDYEPTMYHLRLVKKLLSQSADQYREKYEISTKNIDDLKLAIVFLSALRRLALVLGNRDEEELIKKKQSSWVTRFEADLKKK